MPLPYLGKRNLCWSCLVALVVLCLLFLVPVLTGLLVGVLILLILLILLVAILATLLATLVWILIGIVLHVNSRWSDFSLGTVKSLRSAEDVVPPMADLACARFS